MTIKVFIATSLDGFIARADGGLDWLPGSGDGGDGDGGGGDSGDESGAVEGDLGYGDVMASVDALVMGRNTYDTVRGFADWPYGDKPVVILTSRPQEISHDLPPHVSTMNGNPDQVVAELAAKGFKNLYIDGGILIQQFLRAGLVDELIITTIPVLIGSGISLFGQLQEDIKLDLVTVQSHPGGLVQSHYLTRKRESAQ